MNVWRLKTHHEDAERALSWTKQNGRIAVGWGIIGDILQKGYGSADEIAHAIGVAYREGLHSVRNAASGGSALWDLSRTMQEGDLVILSGALPRELVVEIQGPYEWREETPLPGDNYNHQRRVLRRYLNPDKLWRAAGAAPADGHSVRWTLIRLASPVTNDDLNEF